MKKRYRFIILVFAVFIGLFTKTQINALQDSRWREAKGLEYSEFIEKSELLVELEYSDKIKLEYDRELLSLEYSDFVIGSELGLYEGADYFSDTEGYSFKVNRSVKVVDTTPPEFVGLAGLSVDFGSKFDYSDLGVSGVDGYDGALEVSYSGDVDTNKAGSYEVLMGIEDSSGNSVEASVTVVVKAKPVPKVTPKAVVGVKGRGSSPVVRDVSSVNLPNRSIYFHKTGVLVPYADIGIGKDAEGALKVQNYIDTYKGNAGTFYGPESIPNFTSYHSNLDGLQTYFAAHASNGFRSAMDMSVGERVTVKDSSGHEQVYEVYAREVSKVEIQATYIREHGYDKHIEGIVFQTCLTLDALPVALTFLKVV